MTIFNTVGSGGESGGLTLAKMWEGTPFEVKPSDWPDSIMTIPSYCINYNPNVTKIEVPNGCTSIGYSSFAHCANLTDIILPNSVTSIDGFALAYNPIPHITLPNNITAISQGCFYNCTELLDITIPNSVTSIEPSAFSGDSKLASITWGSNVNTIGRYAFSSCYRLNNFEIPSSITLIGESAFQALTSTAYVTIHNNPSLSIGNNAFVKLDYNAPVQGGATITLTGTTPPTIQSTTFSQAKIKKIIVPQGTLNTYQTATNWSAYANKMEEAQ